MASSTTLMDGKALANRMLDEVRNRVERIREATQRSPCLATVLVGADPASVTYTRMKRNRCESVGMSSRKIELPERTTTAELTAAIRELAEDESVNGILLQHPVPSHVDERAGFEAIPAEKDVDGVTLASFGAMTFPEDALPGYASCTPGGIMRLLRAYDLELEGRHAVIVGRSPILGKPMAMMLLAANCTVTICHSRTTDVGAEVGRADLVIAAVGKPEFVKGEWIKEGAVVIDAGYNEGHVGDVEFDSALPRSRLITPVPGGVGPMTIATLIDQTATAAARQWDVDLATLEPASDSRRA